MKKEISGVPPKEKINVFPFEAFEYPFNMELFGITECEQPYVTTHDPCRNYIVEYIVSGSGTLIYNGKVYHPQEGDVYILHKGSFNQYYPDQDNTWTKYWFNGDGPLMVNLLVAYGLYDTILIKGFYHEEMFREMYEIASSDLPTHVILEKMSLKFHELLMRLHSHINRKLVKNSANDIKRILDSNIYNRNFKMEDLSSILHLSQTHIINTFKEFYTLTPYRYLFEQRIQVAGTMLLTTDMSVKKISETLGFSDQHYFSNAFKKITGKPPQQYRKENRHLYAQLSNLNLKTHH